jgi:chromosome segregation ATPase
MADIIREKEELARQLKEVIEQRDKCRSESSVYKLQSEEHAKKILEQADQLAATKKDLDELREVNKKLQDEINLLRSELDQMKQKSTNLQKRLDNQDTLVHAHNLVRLYIYYYVEPHLGGKLWSEVAGALSEKIADREDNVISAVDFDRWIKATFPRVSVPIEDLQKLNQVWHSITHTYAPLTLFYVFL